MTTRRVLDVGQCALDHAAISRLLTEHFDVEVHRADRADEVVRLMRGQRFDLVLINRRLDADDSDGTVVLREIKSSPASADTPVMLVSNYPEAQAAAVELGAEPGFGKAELHRPEVVDQLAGTLGQT